MRRALSALGMTATGVVLVLRFHSSASGPRPLTTTAGPSVPTSPGTATPTVPPPTGPGASVPAPGSGSAPTTAKPGGPNNGTFTGALVDTRFGPVQVRVTIANGRLTDVQELVVPSDRRRSVEINQYAAPILRDEALSVQSSTIDQVSGATITWDAYSQSLQAALDAANHR
ncbi:MAG: hypothetical protein JWM05_107 [Acidimicrobiales bacterium]|nr:hypothetical protein [Acidimicrobiales bacterium]